MKEDKCECALCLKLRATKLCMARLESAVIVQFPWELLPLVLQDLRRNQSHHLKVWPQGEAKMSLLVELGKVDEDVHLNAAEEL